MDGRILSIQHLQNHLVFPLPLQRAKDCLSGYGGSKDIDNILNWNFFDNKMTLCLDFWKVEKSEYL